MSTINPENTPKPQGERKAMGRGLSSLIGGSSPAPQANRSNTLQERHEPLKQNMGIAEIAAAVEKATPSALREVDIEKVSPNPEQPRRHFNPEKIEELAASLKEQGLLSPIVVKEVAPDAYQIIAGERRWRASQVAGLKKISVIVREKQKTGIENDLAAIVENIQREDLNPLELAAAYGRMVKTYQITQEELAQKLGISRVKLANTLRLLKLPEDVREMLNQSRISEGHARALLALPTEALIRDVAAQAAQFHLSVRDVETRVRNLITAHEHPQSPQANALQQTGPKNQNTENTKGPQLMAVEDELRKIFGTKVSIVGKKSGGIIELYYSGEDSLNRLVHQMRQTLGKSE